MLSNLSIDPGQTTKKITAFIQKTVHKAGFQKVILGLSGGLDSAVSAALAIRALGVENVHVVILPYGIVNKQAEEDAILLANHLAIQPPARIATQSVAGGSNIHSINIQPFVDPIFLRDDTMDNIRKGNMMARMRMMLIFDVSKKINALVLGTENKTEQLLGYFTRYGDAASDIEPIQSLYKTQVKQLAEYLEIPPKIITKPPTAGLFAGQTDEGDFGFTYEEADKILYLHVDKKMNEEEIIQNGFEKNMVGKVLERMKQNSFKRNVPYIFENIIEKT